MYDALIIGSGPAGLSAALWCDDLALRSVVLERRADAGGQLLWIHNPVTNHLGTPHAGNGWAMRDSFAAQLAARKIELRTNAEVARIDAHARRVLLANGEEMTARAVVLATGLRRRTLSIPGEAEFHRRGVIASGARDRALVAGQVACVVGGGDAAAENALLLAEVCPRVWLIHRGANLRAGGQFVARVRSEKRIVPLLSTTVERIVGGERVEGIELRRSGDTERLAVGAVLVRIGYEPNAELLRGQVEQDAAGYISVTPEHETSVANVFAIGDVSNPRAPTISGAVGAGATVAKIIEARKREAN